MIRQGNMITNPEIWYDTFLYSNYELHNIAISQNRARNNTCYMYHSLQLLQFFANMTQSYSWLQIITLINHNIKMCSKFSWNPELQAQVFTTFFGKFVLAECLLISNYIFHPFFSVMKTRITAHTSHRTHQNKPFAT